MIDPGPITREGAARAARDELSKAIYHHDSDPLPVRVVKAVGRFIDHLLNGAFHHAPAGGWGALILLAVIAAVVGLVIWRVGMPRLNPASPTVLPADAPVSRAADHRRRAILAAEQQDWNTAVIERMRAVARELEERAVLDPRAGRTATELAADAATRIPTAVAALAAAAETFNAVAYGAAPAGAADLATVIAADHAVSSSGSRLVSA
ncbi:MAG TPA: DUF4129 domain-containing protein [Mycobacteriales bacterium]|nr:DUF4129 domain-containing protein [Mycobacteriales bacterium]